MKIMKQNASDQASIVWESEWISAPFCGGPRTGSPAPYFRKSFNLTEKPKHAVLHITARGIYEGEINGIRVAEDVFAPGWTDFRKRIYVSSYDATALLRAGENVLGAILGDGWYCGAIAQKERQYYGERPMLLAQLEIEFANGKKMVVTTGKDWKVSAGPILENDLLMGESYDARRELGAWSSPGYDDSTWQSVLSQKRDSVLLEPSPGSPVRRIGEPIPGTIIRGAGSKEILYDFSQNLSGRLRITVKGARGMTLRLRHAEILDADGNLYLANLRSARCTDYYTLKGGGTEVWEPRFTFHGFRYASLHTEGSVSDFSLEKVEAIVLHTMMKETGTFRCSHPLLNRLESNISWGQKGNFLEVPTDCPQRDERLGWTGDAQVFIRTAAFHMDVRRFFKKWLKDLRDAQLENGSIPPTIPDADVFSLPKDGGPAWAEAGLICPWTLYLATGDLSWLREQYGSMAAYQNFLTVHKVKEGIRAHPEVDPWGGFGDWLALDGSGLVYGGTAKDLIGTAMYANNALILSKTARLLGFAADEKKWLSQRSEIQRAFQHRFVTPEGLLASATQTAYVLALHFELLTPEQEKVAGVELVRDIQKRNFHLTTGFVGTPYLLHVLEKIGALDVAYKLLEQETFPSWLFPVKHGATTIWERWDGWTPDKGFQDKGMNSFNHYAYGAVGDFMVSTVAGMAWDEAEPGYQRIRFKPRPGGTITWAEASLATDAGEIAIRWELADGNLVVHLAVPEGSRASFSTPPDFESKETEFGPGRHQLNLSRKTPKKHAAAT